MGFPVFPLHTPCSDPSGSRPRCSCGKPDCPNIGKHPRTRHGFKDATTDEATIRGWWGKWPDANMGVPTGAASGFVAIDLDPRNGGHVALAELEEVQGKLPGTVEALTGGGGRHILFAHTALGIKSRTFAPGLDVKADGGYIVVEPSLHVSGRRYAWELSSRLGEVPLAAMPPWLLELVIDKPGAAPAQSAREGEGPIAEGERNSTLASLAGCMRRRGMSCDAIVAALEAENRARCSPPLDHAEVEKIGRSVSRYAPAAPPSGGKAQSEWPPPSPLHTGPAAPPFPVADAFPSSLHDIRDFCVGLAEELQVPADLPIMLLPPIVAVSLAQKFIIEIRPGWSECSALWTISLLESGERKSVALRRMTDPLIEWERDEAERLAPEIAAANERRELLERDRQEARKKGAKGNAEAREEAVNLAKQLAVTEALSPPSLLATDATSEALVGLMVTNGERALVGSPEADALDVMMGRYDDRARPNLGVWLKGYSGDRVRVHRRSRPPEFLERPALSVALAVQPEAVHGLFASRLALGRGLLARFLASVPVPMVGRRRIGAPPVPERLQMAYEVALRRLLDIPLDASLSPRTVRLSPDAAERFEVFETWVEAQLAAGGELSDQRAWGAKLCGAIARIALALHCLEMFGRSQRTGDAALTVSDETVQAALAWAPYLIAHARIAAGVAGCEPELVVADRVLGWLERSGLGTFTRRDCFTAIRGQFVRAVEDVDQPLKLLEELGYFRPRPTKPPAEKGGRPASPGFVVNPCWERRGVR